MIGTIDYVVIVVYLLFMMALGPIYKRFNSTASDYFRGGGGMLWWMVGASSFMVTFSAWTFTGAAGKAFELGTFVLLLFVANAAGLVFSIFLTAHRYRQLRVITPVEAIYNRFGRANEQFFTWLPIPLNLIFGGIGMYAIGIFMQSVFQIELWVVIIALGMVVTVMSVFGGAAAVVASDFMQFVTIIVVSLVMMTRTFAAPEVGGVSGFIENLPAAHTDWTALMRPEIIVIFGVTLFFNQILQGNSLQNGAARYVFVKTGRDARKAAGIALIGFLFFPVIWLIPAMAATSLHPELGVIRGMGPLVAEMEEERGKPFENMSEVMSAAQTNLDAAVASVKVTHQEYEFAAERFAEAAARKTDVDQARSELHELNTAAAASADQAEIYAELVPQLAEAAALGVEPDNVFMHLKNPKEAAYVATAMSVLPNGMMGLLVCAIFAATMSTMDSGLNRSAGIVVRNFYLPILKPEASEKEQLNLGKILTALMGVVMTVLGLMFSTLQTLPLFELILLLAALIGLPTAIPLFYGIFVKRVPAWSAWSTVLVGMTLGGLVQWKLSSDVVAQLLGYDTGLTDLESSNLLIGVTTGVNFGGCTLWFFGTMLFWKYANEPYKQQVEEFFDTMHTPVDVVAENVPGWDVDRMHYQVLGFMCMAYGGLICLLALLPNDLSGRLAFLFCGGIIGGLGVVFAWISKRKPVSTRGDAQATGYVESD